MRATIRAAITAGFVVLAVAIGLTARTLYLFGVLTPVTPAFAGKCSAIGRRARFLHGLLERGIARH